MTMTRAPLAQRLLETVREEASHAIIHEVRVGVIYTAVKLVDGRVGLALSFPGTFGKMTHQSFAQDRPLANKSALIGLRGMLSLDPVEAAVGVATLNALLAHRAEGLPVGEIKDLLTLGADDHVAMVGYLRSLVPIVKARGAKLSIFEMEQTAEVEVYPAEKAFDVIPQCSVAIMTATTLINGTLDRLLEVAVNCREVILVGPSAPLCEAVWKDTCVTAVGGVSIHPEHVTEVLTAVSEGGGMRVMKPYLRKRNLKWSIK